MNIRLILGAAWLLMLAACSSVTPPATAPVTTVSVPLLTTSLAPVVTTPAENAAPIGITREVQPQSAVAAGTTLADTTPAEVEPKPVMSVNRAVIALLDRAEVDSKVGKRDAAGASLERALRIEPRNPWLWLQLAQVRLSQGQYAQAITLSRKSNSFAARNYRLQADNWQVIAQSRVALGDTAGAEQAYKQAADLALQARAEQH